MRLEHVNLTVSDLDRSIRFYAELLGWKIRWRGQTRAGLPAVHVGSERFYLALFASEPGASPNSAPVRYGEVGINHFGLVVDDLEAHRRRARDLGVAIHHDSNDPPGRRFYFMDPDGVEVELVEYDAKAQGGAS